MYRSWLLQHRRTLILLVAGTLAALSMATAMGHEPALNTGGDVEASEEPGDVDEPEDADTDDGTVEDEDVDEPEDADSDDEDEDDADEPEDADSDDDDDDDADEPEDADSDDDDEDDAEEDDD